MTLIVAGFVINGALILSSCITPKSPVMYDMELLILEYVESNINDLWNEYPVVLSKAVVDTIEVLGTHPADEKYYISFRATGTCWTALEGKKYQKYKDKYKHEFDIKRVAIFEKKWMITGVK
jgi:hypothetical protein